jgi:hypothetical protein
MAGQTSSNAGVSAAAQPQSSRRVWIIVGIVLAVVSAVVVAFGVGLFFVISGMLKESDAYRSAVQTMEANAQVMEILGAPIKTGFPSGNVHTSGPSGEAQLAIPVEGSKARGTLYVDATKSMGVWKTNELVLQVEGRGERIDLLKGGTTI